MALLFLLPCMLKATRVESIVSGNFFDPLVWSGQQIPDLSSDSIFVDHDLFFDQEIVLQNKVYLYIGACVKLCGGANFTLKQGAFMRIEGTLYTGAMLVQGRVENNGYVNIVPFMRIFDGGSWKNFCAWVTVFGGPQDCSRKGPLSDSIIQIKLEDNTVFLEANTCKCSKKTEFGDETSVSYNSGSVSHTYEKAGSYLIRDFTFCPCDTFVQERRILIDSACTPDISVFPNPGNGIIHAYYLSCKERSITLPLFNAVGQLVRYISISANNTETLNFSDLASGVYFLTPPQESGLKTKRMVIIR